jgi:hypothetical protein
VSLLDFEADASPASVLPVAAEPAPSRNFRSFLLGGFECSSHLHADGSRLDMLEATGHARYAEEDYTRLHSYGIEAARDGLRWHKIDRGSRRGFDWDSWLPMLQAAARTRTQVIWDLCHYGWPDRMNIWSAQFVDRLARYAAAAARVALAETGVSGFYCPVNEISFWAWAGGEVGKMSPHRRRRGGELKRQLVRAYIASVQAIREVDPGARFVVAEPLIHIVCEDADERTRNDAEAYRQAQFEAHEMLTGAAAPELGGKPDFLDIVGVNFYPHNQWYWQGNTIPLGHHAYRPLSAMLAEAYERVGRPIFIAETGAEGCSRPYWLHHVCAETMHAIELGVPVEGVCLYPILDYPGWENGRICPVGLLSMPDASGNREAHEPMARELIRQQALFASAKP